MNSNQTKKALMKDSRIPALMSKNNINAKKLLLLITTSVNIM